MGARYRDLKESNQKMREELQHLLWILTGCEKAFESILQNHPEVWREEIITLSHGMSKGAKDRLETTLIEIAEI